MKTYYLKVGGYGDRSFMTALMKEYSITFEYKHIPVSFKSISIFAIDEEDAVILKLKYPQMMTDRHVKV